MSQVFCAPLDHLAVLELKGGQPDKLLQGQVTCDLRLLSEKQALPGLLCNLKGRVIASFDLVCLAADHLLLLLPADSVPALSEHLKKFLPFFRTQLNDVTAEWQPLGLSGKETPALLGSLVAPWPQTEYGQSSDEPGIILRLPATLLRALVLLRRQHEGFTSLLERIRALTEATPASCWRMLDIQAGRTEVNATLSDAYLPQMLNFQAQGAISFKKGCYTGQEIIARAQYRGQVKKRLYRVHLPSSELPPLPLAILDAEDKAVGEILQAAPDRHGTTEALAVISIKSVDEDQKLFVQLGEQRTKLNLLKLPYDPEGRRNAPFEAA